jgi:hypothetical protein
VGSLSLEVLVITADQLLLHIVGDYVIQSDWMATEKTKRSLAALAHVVTYAIPFLLLTRSAAALAVIVGTHFVIDRWRLARYVCWTKNWLAPAKWCLACDRWGGECHETHQVPRNPPWAECAGTGYSVDRPAWLATWLMIIVDNTMHVAINGAALRWL